MCRGAETAHDGASSGATDEDGDDKTLVFLALFLVAFCPRLSKTLIILFKPTAS